jgi:GNAT superfamily N-acetyltransferase
MALRALRLSALADAPMAFGSTLAEEQARREAVWRERAALGAAGDDRALYVAETDGRWVGMAAGVVEPPDPQSPTAPSAPPPDPLVSLVSMWVDPARRGQGIGAALVDAVARWAQTRGARHLELWVTTTNDAAIALYRRCGFHPTGETQPLDHTPSVLEMRMLRDLR